MSRYFWDSPRTAYVGYWVRTCYWWPLCCHHPLPNPALLWGLLAMLRNSSLGCRAASGQSSTALLDSTGGPPTLLPSFRLSHLLLHVPQVCHNFPTSQRPSGIAGPHPGEVFRNRFLQFTVRAQEDELFLTAICDGASLARLLGPWGASDFSRRQV